MSGGGCILMGIGNEQRADDGVGVFVARNLSTPGWLTLECHTAPESFTGVVKRHLPDYLVLVDAAELGLSPGSFRVIPPDEIKDASVGTHSLPLSLLIEYLRSSVSEEILFVGVQPKEICDGEGLSEEVERGARELMFILEERTFHRIPVLERSGNTV